MAASVKKSLQWAQKRDDRAGWARAALLEADMGSASPFTYFDETTGELRSVRVALVLPGDSSLEKLMNDETYRDQVDALYRAGAVVAFDRKQDPFDILLVSEDINLRDRIQCAGIGGLQERGLILLWEPFVNEALETSTPVFGEDEASVALRKKHAIFWRTPKTGKQRTDQKPTDVVDGIPRVPLGNATSFRVRPEVLEASDRRAAARRAAKGRGVRGR